MNLGLTINQLDLNNASYMLSLRSLSSNNGSDLFPAGGFKTSITMRRRIAQITKSIRKSVGI